MKKILYLTAVMLLCMMSAGCGNKEAEQETEAVSEAEVPETVKPEEVIREDMTPVAASELRDGVYEILVDSSSSMFQITACELTVKDGSMQAEMTMGGTGYLKLYMGTGEEALKASEEDMIPFTEKEEGVHSFTVPVKMLDEPVDCAAFSKRKETWYDRKLVFRADSLPTEAFREEYLKTPESMELSDGEYQTEVTLAGGSGKASVESPCTITVKDGKAAARIIWSSSNYDYMIVGEEKYLPVNEEGNSEFEIPVTVFDRPISVKADTTAMSTPHEIDYTLTFGADFFDQGEAGLPHFAEQFEITKDEHGYSKIEIRESGTYLLIPEEDVVPEDLEETITVIRTPVHDIYLAATSAMDHFRHLSAMDRITLSGTDENGWYLEEAKEALRNGSMVFAGKYNAPDYERILAHHCGLAIESTMILHSPEVKEKLEALGIPVLVERSSYESNPLGRMEWIRVYGELLGCSETAEKIWKEELDSLKKISDGKQTGKTAAFFAVNSNRSITVRKSGDYIPKMIEMAGGKYVPQGLSEEENALSTMKIDAEAFYMGARDADFLIYNSTIGVPPHSLDEFLELSPIFRDFAAVREGNVYCTEKNMFQETMGLGDMIRDLNKIFTEEKPDPEELCYLRRLE